MPFSFITQHKDAVMSALCASPDVAALLAAEGELPYRYIFPYDHIDGCVTTASTFICFDEDVTRYGGRASLETQLTLWLITHRSLMRTDTGTRLDRLASAVTKALHGSRGFGIGRLSISETRPLVRFSPAVDFAGRVLTFECRGFLPGKI